MAPALAAVDTYALLLVWDEYLYQYLLLSSPRNWTVAAHDSPYLSDRHENVCEERLVVQHQGETLHQRTQPSFWHHGD